jgi:hypothetical protein
LSVVTRKCPYCHGRIVRETLDIPDSCYCSKCGSYLKIDYTKTTIKGLIARDKQLAFNPSERNSK